MKQSSEENEQIGKFDEDFKEVVNRLYVDNGWKVAKEMINKAGLQFYWEPYYGPFNTAECVLIPDLPMGEWGYFSGNNEWRKGGRKKTGWCRGIYRTSGDQSVYGRSGFPETFDGRQFPFRREPVILASLGSSAF